MSRRRPLFGEQTAIVVLVLYSVISDAQKIKPCDRPSSCGSIRNISYPFRLASDPEHCGEKKYELECDNNRTVLHLYAGKYYVEAINYDNQTIRLVDVGIQKGDCSSSPLYSLTFDNFSDYRHRDYQMYMGAVVMFLNCENPAKSPLYMELTGSCLGKAINSSTNSAIETGYRYVVAGDPIVSDVEDLCRVEMVTMITPYFLPSAENGSRKFSLKDVHNAMAYGFELELYYSGVVIRRLRHPFIATFLDKARMSVDFIIYLDKAVIAVWAGMALAARTLFGMPFFLAFLIYKFRKRHLSMFDGIENFLQTQNDLNPIRYSYWNINVMTEGFKDKLGQGGYGSVFKGKLRSGHFVAVKMLDKSKGNGQEFINEVATIGRIHHINVVRLVGYCVEGSKRALVYDFMPNGSLEKYIFSQEGTSSLSYQQIYEICLGVARGIDYLHHGCNMQILHFDIKPHNILLDQNFCPKISDFGLAKLYAVDDSIVSLTAARGTFGYMAPELFYKNIGGVSHKADVYSFGILLMEMAGKRRNLNAFADHTSQIYFPSWVYDQLKEGREVELGQATEEERVVVRKMIMVAFWCIQTSPADRPSMSKVVEMLEGDVEPLQLPPKPSLCPEEASVAEDNGKDINLVELPLLSSE
ncbi:Glycerophosphodiester phosphodiesterase [Bertholletia excelsa]